MLTKYNNIRCMGCGMCYVYKKYFAINQIITPPKEKL